MKGGPGAAQMFGDDGNDTLVGGAGNEFLSGGSGNDTLSGGAGNDTFMFSSGFGKDVITDFQNTNGAHDVLQFDRAVFANFNAVQSHMTQNGTSVVITFDANKAVEVKNTTVDQLHATDFIFV